LRRAEKADPLSKGVQYYMGIVLIAARRYDEAEAYVLEGAGPLPRNMELGRVRLGQGRIAEAVQLLENDPARPESPPLRGYLGVAYARSGRREEAEKLAAAAQYPLEQALIFASLGAKDRTLEALERMGSLGAPRLGRWLTFSDFDFLRGDPRLAALRRNVGLPQENTDK